MAHEFELHHHSGSCSLDIDIDHFGLDGGFGYEGLHLAGDVVEPVVGGGGYSDGFMHSNLAKCKLSQ